MEGVSGNSDGTVNLQNNFRGQGLFPVIKDFEILENVGDLGNAKVMLNGVPVQPNWSQHSCQQTSCSWYEVNVLLFFEFETELIRIVDV